MTLFVTGALVALALVASLRASLPLTAGEHSVAGLNHSVRISRDAFGVPTIHAATELDAMRALGFLHAQERFFQMDLLRRTAAGELAQLFGPALLPRDRGHRFHRLREVAQRALGLLPAEQRARLAAYTDGVNAGLTALSVRPPEYLALRVQPHPWQAQDSLLVGLAMFLDLQDERAQRDANLGLLHAKLPLPMVEFLVPKGTEWDAPLVGEVWPAPPPPGPDVYTPAPAPPRVVARAAQDPELGRIAVGSNAWAVAGALTPHGGAMVAGDMHLGHSVPNVWYRACWRVSGQDTVPSGVTLPGVPALVAGSNGYIAWTFTNSYGDFSDLIELDLDPDRPGHYLTASGSRAFEYYEEVLQVRGGEPERLLVTHTEWGPLVDADSRGRLRALRWVAHNPEALNLTLVQLEAAQAVGAALTIAQQAGVPAQNFIVGDRGGHIAWTVAGRLPRRPAGPAATPVSWSAPQAQWAGWLAPAEYPRVVDPPSGRLWSANQRMVDAPALRALGDGGLQMGARAAQIRDRLTQADHFSEADMLSIQLDDRAVFLARWQELLVSILTPEALEHHPARQSLREAVARWGGRAAVDSAGYRLVRAFRLFLAERVFDFLLAEVAREDGRFDIQAVSQWEGPLWQLVSERPSHLLNPVYQDWNAQLLAAADAVVEYAAKMDLEPAEFTWGKRNSLQMKHPFSHLVSVLGPWLDMPPLALPGDEDMPRVQAPTFGASERLVVAAGREAQAMLHMPGGQSGHPLSPHYADGFDAWARGKFVPLQPGPAQHTLLLQPSR